MLQKFPLESLPRPACFMAANVQPVLIWAWVKGDSPILTTENGPLLLAASHTAVKCQPVLVAACDKGFGCVRSADLWVDDTIPS